MRKITNLFIVALLMSSSCLAQQVGSHTDDAAYQEASKNKAMDDFVDEVNNKNRPNTARKGFALAFDNAQDALKADKLSEAKVYVEKLHKIPNPNRYEQSRIHLIDYWYQGKLGNKEAENEAAAKLMQIGLGNVDANVYVEAGIRLLKRQYNAKNFGGAIETLAFLREEPSSHTELMSIVSAVQQLDGISASTQDIIQPITTDSNGKWSVKLLRPTFFMDKINGEVNSLDLKCENKQASLAYKAESVMSTPASWGSCNVKINAKPNTTFNFVQLVNKPVAQ